MVVGESDTLVCKTSANCVGPFLESDPDLSVLGGILDRIVEEDQEELMEESFIPGVGDLRVQFSCYHNILGSCARAEQGASLFKTLVDVKRFAHQVQLTGVGHGQGKEPLHDTSQFLKLAVKHVERLLIILG